MTPNSLRVPDDLAELDQWVLRLPNKIPYGIDGRPASSTNPRTWSSFQDALAAWRRTLPRYPGLGFVFSPSNNLTGIDLDNVLDSGGNLKSWGVGIVNQFADTYMEVSPSGLGLKIWARGSIPSCLAKVRVGDGGVEMYDRDRYFTVTGQVFRGAPLEIEDHDHDLNELYRCLTQGRGRWQLQPLDGGRIPHGQQHSQLVSICGTLRARRVCDEAIEACLQIINARQCEKPGPRDHISRIVQSSRNWSAAS